MYNIHTHRQRIASFEENKENEQQDNMKSALRLSLNKITSNQNLDPLSSRSMIDSAPSTSARNGRRYRVQTASSSFSNNNVKSQLQLKKVASEDDSLDSRLELKTTYNTLKKQFEQFPYMDSVLPGKPLILTEPSKKQQEIISPSILQETVLQQRTNFSTARSNVSRSVRKATVDKQLHFMIDSIVGQHIPEILETDIHSTFRQVETIDAETQLQEAMLPAPKNETQHNKFYQANLQSVTTIPSDFSMSNLETNRNLTQRSNDSKEILPSARTDILSSPKVNIRPATSSIQHLLNVLPLRLVEDITQEETTQQVDKTNSDTTANTSTQFQATERSTTATAATIDSTLQNLVTNYLDAQQQTNNINKNFKRHFHTEDVFTWRDPKVVQQDESLKQLMFKQKQIDRATKDTLEFLKNRIQRNEQRQIFHTQQQRNVLKRTISSEPYFLNQLMGSVTLSSPSKKNVLPKVDTSISVTEPNQMFTARNKQVEIQQILSKPHTASASKRLSLGNLNNQRISTTGASLRRSSYGNSLQSVQSTLKLQRIDAELEHEDRRQFGISKQDLQELNEFDMKFSPVFLV